MITKIGDIFLNCISGDIICFTSNGIVKKDGCLVMGAGNAKEFRDTFKGIDKCYGSLVKKYGNNCLYGGTCVIKNKKVSVVSFPTKHNYKCNSDLNLIEKSCKQIVDIANNDVLLNKIGFDKTKNHIRICAPGVNNGNLNWDDVKPILEKYLDNRFIIHFKNKITESSPIVRHTKRYAGIGSRETEEWKKYCMINIGKWLATKGYELYSGHAQGPDSWFEEGCDMANGNKSIYIPWKGFNGSNSGLYEITEKAMKLAEKYHPAWSKCSEPAKKLMARNCYQVLGLELNNPVDFVVCNTKQGKLLGGTAQALRIAMDYNIPIFNFGNYNNIDEARVAFNNFCIQYKI